jgi:hypothetical protein
MHRCVLRRVFIELQRRIATEAHSKDIGLLNQCPIQGILNTSHLT